MIGPFMLSDYFPFNIYVWFFCIMLSSGNQMSIRVNQLTIQVRFALIFQRLLSFNTLVF